MADDSTHDMTVEEPDPSASSTSDSGDAAEKGPPLVVTQRVPIPRDLAPVLIGKRGAYITRLQQDTNCHIFVAHAQREDAFWSTVVIRGNASNVWHAFKRVMTVAYTASPSERE